MKHLAAFIMTYQRYNLVEEAVYKLLNQTWPPDKILVVDNSPDTLTESLVKTINSPIVQYHRVGYNAGPAGAARIGLVKLAEEGYEWIYWGDDDDPPPHNDTFEKLLSIPNNYKSKVKIGQMGLVGHKVNLTLGLIVRTSDQMLMDNSFLEIDTISGNQCKIVNRAVILKGALPTEKLFFGFEELDFDIQVKKLGYSSVVRTDLFMEQRSRSDRGSHIQAKLIGHNQLWRRYYSFRNLLHIFKKNRMYGAMLIIFFKIGIKLLTGFRFGWHYGLNQNRFLLLAVSDWLRNIYGKKNFQAD